MSIENYLLLCISSSSFLLVKQDSVRQFLVASCFIYVNKINLNRNFCLFLSHRINSLLSNIKDLKNEKKSIRYMEQNLEDGLKFCEKNFLHRELFNFKNTKLKNETNSFLKKERESKFYKFCDIKENSISNRSFHFQKTNIKKSCRVFILYITSTNLRSIDYNV